MYIYEPIYKEDRTIALSSKKIVTPYDDVTFTYAGEAADIVTKIAKKVIKLQSKREEHLYVFFIDKKSSVVGFSELSHGNQHSTDFGAKEIILRTVLTGTPSIILAHNHPSYNFHPSNIDLKRTAEINKAMNLVDITLLDHIIIASTGKTWSMKQESPQVFWK